VRGKMDTMMPKQSQWREKLEQLQKQVANMEEHLSLLPQIQTVEKQIKNTQEQINKVEKGTPSVFSSSKGQALGSSPSIFAFVPSAPAESVQSSSQVQMQQSTGSLLPKGTPLGQQQSTPPGSGGGSRKKGRTHRIRASTRALRQRARE